MKLIPLFTPHRSAANGSTLIELLVAMLVLAIGLLGLAGLQTFSVRNTHSAYLRSQATMLAHDILDRMRANPTSAQNGQYNVALAAAPAGAGVAADDLTEWKASLSRLLPSGDGAVAPNLAGGRTLYTITIQWDDTRSQGAPQQFATSTEL